jgi:endonuclease/exonuclease/phosphatase (EEP) superfamily protein YafD
MTIVDRLLATPPLTALGLFRPLVDPSPRRHPHEKPSVAAPGAAGFRLVTNNGLDVNRRPDAWARAVLDLDPGVLVVQEATDPLVAALERAGVGDELPHSFVDPDRGKGGCALWSRLPLADTRTLATDYPAVVASVRIGDANVTVVGVHPLAPVAPWDAGRWRAAFDAVADVVMAATGPVVCAGDWNATISHQPLVDLLARTGMVDAHTAAGRSDARTWPAQGVGGPFGFLQQPFALLDRVLVTPDLAVRAITEATVPGSDHRAVIADLALATS